MPDIFTHAGRERSQRLSRHFTSLAVECRREDAMRFLAKMEEALDAALMAETDKAFVRDTARDVYDEVQKLSKGMKADLDAEGILHEWHDIDMSELDDIIARAS